MNRDRQEELERLEQQLLDEEASEEEFEEETEEEYEDDPEEFEEELPEYESYNTDNCDIDLDQLSDQLNTPPRHSWTGFAVAMLLFTCIIVAVLGYWLLKQRGVL